MTASDIPEGLSPRSVGQKQSQSRSRCPKCGAHTFIPIGSLLCHTKPNKEGYWVAGYVWADYPHDDGGLPLFWLRRRTRKR